MTSRRRQAAGRLGERVFDCLVIGGGIHGAAIAWQAALAGLRVALVERADFGASTSASSQRTLHGGLRDLQRGDLRALRAAMQEQRTWLRIAPHLVEPRAFVIPFAARTQGAAVSAGLWFEAQMWDSERLTLACVQSAAAAGAVVANYVEAQRPHLLAEQTVTTRLQDLLSDDFFELRSAHVVDTSGTHADAPPSLLAYNLALPGLEASAAVCVMPRQRNSTTPGRLFLIPWRGISLLGTAYRPADAIPSRPTREDALALLRSATPGIPRLPDHVSAVHWGRLPATANRRGLLQSPRVKTPSARFTIVSGVKYTTALAVARAAITQVRAALGLPRAPLRDPVPGGFLARSR